jgi:hypothetical protein
VVTSDELDELLADCPTLYHMAEHGSWASIRRHGLLSTSALLDLYEIKGARRVQIEERHRSAGIPLDHPRLPRAIIRDQIPMDDGGLRRCLPESMTPFDWYRLLNKKVFFWFTRERLLRLLNAAAYRDKTHDVVEVDARRLVEAYYDQIWLCPINSGCTKPMPHPRGEDTFRRINDYPYSMWRAKRKKGERVVELAVEHSVPDIPKFVKRVVHMRGDKKISSVRI